MILLFSTIYIACSMHTKSPPLLESSPCFHLIFSQTQQGGILQYRYTVMFYAQYCFLKLASGHYTRLSNADWTSTFFCWSFMLILILLLGSGICDCACVDLGWSRFRSSWCKVRSFPSLLLISHTFSINWLLVTLDRLCTTTLSSLANAECFTAGLHRAAIRASQDGSASGHCRSILANILVDHYLLS